MVELRGFEPLTFCMPCSMVSSDGVALGLVATVQSGYRVWGGLARSGGIWVHTGRPPARCPWFGSFSGGPRSEPDWRLSAHPALQRLSRAVRGWLPPAACTPGFRRRFGVVHYAYLPVSGHPQPPGPLRPAGGFPALPGGALLPRLLRGLCHRGTRVRQVIPRSSLSYVLARPRLPVHLLGCPRWASPRHWRCARTQRHAGAVPGPGFMRLSGGAKFYPGWRLGFRQSSFSHIARVPAARRPYASARPLVSWHALVPFTFQIQVSHQTQEYPPNPSRLHWGYDRAPRGAGWSLVWYWFCRTCRSTKVHRQRRFTMAIRITGDTMTLETATRVLATDRFRAARRSHEVQLGHGVIGF